MAPEKYGVFPKVTTEEIHNASFSSTMQGST